MYFLIVSLRKIKVGTVSLTLIERKGPFFWYYDLFYLRLWQKSVTRYLSYPDINNVFPFVSSIRGTFNGMCRNTLPNILSSIPLGIDSMPPSLISRKSVFTFPRSLFRRVLPYILNVPLNGSNDLTSNKMSSHPFLKCCRLYVVDEDPTLDWPLWYLIRNTPVRTQDRVTITSREWLVGHVSLIWGFISVRIILPRVGSRSSYSFRLLRVT